MIVSVIVPDNVVVVDGVGFVCTLPERSDNMRTLSWDGEYGRIEVPGKDPIWFANEALVTPYIDVWSAAKQAYEALITQGG